MNELPWLYNSQSICSDGGKWSLILKESALRLENWYSGTPLVRPPLLHQKSGLLRGGGLSSGVEINTFMFRFTLSSGLSRGGGL